MKPILIKKKIYNDKRGYFQEILKLNEIPLKIKINFTATSFSRKNVIRGLHFQKKNQQTKIITVIKGKIMDICVNLKKKDKNYKKVFKFILERGDLLIIPKYYAHGIECLSKDAHLFYHLDKYQDKKNEAGIVYNDKKLKIKWYTKKPILSKRDKNLMTIEQFEKEIKSL
jgi:dTDP-4-dehydrorhamnose 3,5-epimerase